MDLQDFAGKADAGVEMVVAHPGTGEPTDAAITLAGVDSQAWRRANHELASRLLKSSRGKIDKTFGEREANTAEMLASVTLRWRNVEDEGKQLVCTPEIAKKLYLDYPWLAEQVDSFIGNRANFFCPVAAQAPGSNEG